jgi:hypothetical protein
MTDTSYNGWTNYETWLVNMWIDNDEGSQDMWRERADEAIAATDDSLTFAQRKADAVFELADTLKAEFEEGAETLGATGFWFDLINASLSQVNWREIAAAICEGIES